MKRLGSILTVAPAATALGNGAAGRDRGTGKWEREKKGEGRSKMVRMGSSDGKDRAVPRQWKSRVLACAVALLLMGILPTSASATFASQGGPVELQPHLYLIFWGSGWTSSAATRSTRSELETLYHTISGSSWADILSQYWAPTGIGPEGETTFSFVSKQLTMSSYVDTTHGAFPTSVSESTIATEIAEAVAANKGNGWPQGPTANDQFVVLPAPGTTYSEELMSPPSAQPADGTTVTGRRRSGTSPTRS